MRNSLWIPAGIGAGLLSGLPFGLDYMLAGAAIGLAAGAGIFAVMRSIDARSSRSSVKEAPKSPRRNP